MSMDTGEAVYSVRIHDEADEGLWAEVEELPGCFATGDTMDELWASLRESISLYLSTPERMVEVTLAGSEPQVTHREVIETRRVRAMA